MRINKEKDIIEVNPNLKVLNTLNTAERVLYSNIISPSP
jgi:hypothetical protein